MKYTNGKQTWNLPDRLIFDSATSYARLRYTVEYREPRSGEFFLSGAVITAYRAYNDLTNKYLVATPIGEA